MFVDKPVCMPALQKDLFCCTVGPQHVLLHVLRLTISSIVVWSTRRVLVNDTFDYQTLYGKGSGFFVRHQTLVSRFQAALSWCDSISFLPMLSQYPLMHLQDVCRVVQFANCDICRLRYGCC